MPRHCFANSLGGAHPHHCGGLCNEASVSSVTLCRPLLYGSRAAPSKGGRTLEPSSRDSAGSNRDARPAGAPSPPLSILCGHPRPCYATPRTAPTAPTLSSTRGQDAATPATALRTERRQRLPRARLKTPRSTTTPLPSKLLLFEHRTRHDAATRARFVRTAVNSTTLYAMPPHVAK
jgi:hypothetical protein